MFLQAPHLRFEGLYVSRNTYIRQGAVEWKREKTCHLVTYFRCVCCRGLLMCDWLARGCWVVVCWRWCCLQWWSERCCV